MARIRTIKPEFWTDGALMECSLNARLLFIGTWNFADDFGNLDRSAKQLKARVFPADSLDCEPLILELLAQGLLIEYEVAGKKFLHIQGFTKHQVINRPGKPQCPPCPNSLSSAGKLSEDSVNGHGAFTTGREGKGKERKGKDSASPKPPSEPPASSRAEETIRKPEKDPFDDCEAILRSIPGLKDHPVAIDPVIAPIWQLCLKGFDLKTQIVPSITRQVQTSKRPIRRWSFFVPGIESDASPTATGVKNSVSIVDDAKWSRLIDIGRRKNQWDVKNYGPIPGHSGCRVPAHLLAPGDGEGWTDWRPDT